MVHKALFSSLSIHWATPKALYEELNQEFHFNDDPCPLHSTTDGLNREWGTSTFVNPPYKRKVTELWIKKAYEESQKGKIIVMLLPSRTDTAWFHDYLLKGEIRFIRGRVKFIKSPERESIFGIRTLPVTHCNFQGQLSQAL